MASKKRPSGVPEENVYDKLHWSIVIAMLMAIAALYLLVSANS